MTVPDSKSIPSSGIPNSAEEIPFSCSTNLSKEANDRIKRLRPGPLATAFLMEMHNSTFGDAGWHRKSGHSELSCAFDLAIWARALECDRSNLIKTRDHLIESGAILWQPGHFPGTGTLTWQFDTPWTAYHRRTAKRLANIVQFPTKETQLNTVAIGETELSTLAKKAVTKLSTVTETELSTPALEVSTGVAPEDPLIKVYVNKDYVEETSDAYASQGVLLHSGETDPKLPIVTPKKKATKAVDGSTKEKKQRVDQPYWDTITALFAKPVGGAVWFVRNAIKQMRADDVTPEHLEQAATWYKQEHPTWHYSFRAVFNHLDDFFKSLQKGANNGQTDELGWNVFSL